MNEIEHVHDWRSAVRWMVDPDGIPQLCPAFDNEMRVCIHCCALIVPASNIRTTK